MELGEALGGSVQTALLGPTQLVTFTKSLIYCSQSSPVLGRELDFYIPYIFLVDYIQEE